MIIDSHTHIGRNAHINASVSELLNSMDKAEIDKSLVFAGKIADCPNDYLLEQIKPHQDRLYGVAAYHLHDTSEDFEWIKSAIIEKKIVAVKFYLGYDHWYPDDLKIINLLHVMNENNIPAIFHCGDCLNSVKKAKLRYSHPLNVDNVAVEFSNLKIVIAHVGFPWVIDTAEVCFKNDNVYTDVSGFVYGKFSERDIIKFEKMIQQFLEIAPYKKLLFGTDFPISDQTSYLNTAREININTDLGGIFVNLFPEGLTNNVKTVFNL